MDAPNNAADEKANLLKDEFLAHLSHELRTPLSTILTWAELLQHRQSDELLAEGLSVIERSAHALKQVLDDLQETGPFRGS
jgi:signal transduction histidine kinase